MRITGDSGYHRTSRGNEQRKHAPWCGHRIAGSPETGEILNRDSWDYFRTKRACSKRGAKHQSEVSDTTTTDADNYAGYAPAIYYCTTADPPSLWRLWLLHRTEQTLRLRRVWFSTLSKLERCVCWPRFQWSNTLLLDTNNVCPLRKLLHEPFIKPQE